MKLTLLFALFAAALAVKVDPRVFEGGENEGYASFSVHLKSRADLSGVAQIAKSDHDARGWFVYNTLKAHARATQAPIIELLETLPGVKRITPFFIANFIIVEAERSALEILAKRNDIKAINSNRPFKVPLEEPDEIQTPRKDMANEWNIDYVKASVVWEKYGIDGSGFIYANADTGVDYTHAALFGNYKGNNGTLNHNYNWWDGIKVASLPGTGRCGINSQVPCDDNSHGTHTTGTSVGLGGIGVAPGARWIACRNMDRGYGTPESYISCLQFFLAPTNLQGNNANPSVRPHAIGNSYGCVASEGCTGDEFEESVEALRAAGIFMSVSAGNSGPSCSTILDPPATELSVISVGATAYLSDAAAVYSSRGPVSGQKRPNIAAPGSSVRSCVPGGGYSSFSGTSMASPHVGGAVVLLNELCPELIYDVDAFQSLFESSARALYTTQGCGGDSSTTTPNNVFGHGMLDLEASAAQCLSKFRN